MTMRGNNWRDWVIGGMGATILLFGTAYLTVIPGLAHKEDIRTDAQIEHLAETSSLYAPDRNLIRNELTTIRDTLNQIRTDVSDLREQVTILRVEIAKVTDGPHP